MSVLTQMAEAAYPGYSFTITFQGSTSSSDANIIAGTAGTTSYASGKNIYLYYETIFNHEFAHTLGVRHHYDTTSTVGDGSHMPPGETKCLMDRNSTVFCSACRTALGLPLNISDTATIDAAMDEILSRYPPSNDRLVDPPDDPPADPPDDPEPDEGSSCGFIYGMCPVDP